MANKHKHDQEKQQHDVTVPDWWDALTEDERETLLRIVGIPVVQPSSLLWDDLSEGTHERLHAAFKVGPHGRVDFNG